jgi:hypothetical protein
MPPPLRLIDDGVIYHAINGGNNRQDLFRNSADFKAFRAAPAEPPPISLPTVGTLFLAPYVNRPYARNREICGKYFRPKISKDL